MEVMELSDLHHPNCKMNRKINSGGGDLGADHCRRESESSDSILLSPEASKATEAVEFIAEHLRNEDLYIQVGSLDSRLYLTWLLLDFLFYLEPILIFRYIINLNFFNLAWLFKIQVKQVDSKFIVKIN